MNWTQVSENVYKANISNVLVLSVVYYDGYGWRGSIEGAFNFPSAKSYLYMSDAQKMTEEYARVLLRVATDKINE